jgi:serine phosphatase RsbU (regulator of sigma subunit)
VDLQNQEFGRERLTALSRQVNTLPVKEIVQEIRQALENFSEGKPLADDTTLVVFRIAWQALRFNLSWV